MSNSNDPAEPAQDQLRKERNRERAIRRRQRETSEERRRRREVERIRAAARRNGESPAQRQVRQHKGRLRAKRRRDNETEEEKLHRREQNRLRMAERRRLLKAKDVESESADTALDETQSPLPPGPLTAVLSAASVDVVPNAVTMPTTASAPFPPVIVAQVPPFASPRVGSLGMSSPQIHSVSAVPQNLLYPSQIQHQRSHPDHSQGQSHSHHGHPPHPHPHLHPQPHTQPDRQQPIGIHHQTRYGALTSIPLPDFQSRLLPVPPIQSISLVASTQPIAQQTTLPTLPTPVQPLPTLAQRTSPASVFPPHHQNHQAQQGQPNQQTQPPGNAAHQYNFYY
ncbi:hypothetical protein GGF40_004122 [Coemansia sp. RSA 1286]|nr:hypothetical protein IWW45_001185 [Coemansia sp. RSA 485]KAJ2634578.1 hypothetical protein GGF40_004122 [Coemansia sp. RSA 1286]